MTDVVPPPGQIESRAVAIGAAQLSVLALSLSIVALSWRWGGRSGLLHLGVHLLSLVPGLPIGIALFGPRQAGAWLAGSVIGYGMTAAAIWIALVFHASTGPLVAWLIALGLGVAIARGLPRIAVPAWRGSDTTALMPVLLLV